MKGRVFDVQRMCVHDGPGIRTTVFLKGCPLRCLWCHNPESQRVEPELALYAGQCIGCGLCVQVCPNGCHAFVEGRHIIRREHCALCGRCADACVGALSLIGRERTVEEVMDIVRRDVSFYKTSGGGLTVSGGEPLMQPEFTAKLLHAARREGIHTCIETSGYAGFDVIGKLAEDVDLFLYDWKLTDPELHKRYVGVDNRRIRANLVQLDALGCQSILRCPIIPGYNDAEDHFAGIAGLANALHNIQAVHIEPYNRLGEGKNESLGREYPLKGVKTPEEEDVARWLDAVRCRTSVPVLKN